MDCNKVHSVTQRALNIYDNHCPLNRLILNVPFHYVWPRNIAKCDICYVNVRPSVCL